ncbi:MarR family winged helix-turn-helix transcriptional regulator [Ruicaihuangia caeni]|uniref:MarR family transcriptional regulator n=1 Tax=Ruicaihuangia caeni TaxID=3042517 RepID=A0AAW6T666_9MICO|nr:MarR family transcriptional regulator [Klugiella sp. YN-L-19]MDI2098984.1 MarR family transcriptional regulator [Klugiella sp. YN-L-19]
MSEVAAISEREWEVWRTFYGMRRQLDRAIEQQLQEDAGISRPEFEILLALWEAPQKRLRSREIAELIGWEKSRISHQVSRMEARGLVERTECDSDLRGIWVGLTPDGRRAVLGASRKHALKVRELFFDALDAEQLDAVLEISKRVLGSIDAPACDIVAQQAQHAQDGNSEGNSEAERRDSNEAAQRA